MAEQPCLEEAVSRRKTVRGNVFARNVGNHTKQKGSVQKNLPPSAPRCFRSGSRRALFRRNPQIRLMTVTDVPSRKAWDPPRGPVRRRGMPAGAFPPAAGALAPHPGPNVPQPDQASSQLTQPRRSQPSRRPPSGISLPQFRQLSGAA